MNRKFIKFRTLFIILTLVTIFSEHSFAFSCAQLFSDVSSAASTFKVKRTLSKFEKNLIKKSEASEGKTFTHFKEVKSFINPNLKNALSSLDTEKQIAFLHELATDNDISFQLYQRDNTPLQAFIITACIEKLISIDTPESWVAVGRTLPLLYGYMPSSVGEDLESLTNRMIIKSHSRFKAQGLKQALDNFNDEAQFRPDLRYQFGFTLRQLKSVSASLTPQI